MLQVFSFKHELHEFSLIFVEVCESAVDDFKRNHSYSFVELVLES